MKWFATVGFLILALGGCTPSPPRKRDVVTSITMEQYECFWGTCPHYRVVLEPDGSASYTGIAAVRRQGNVVLHPGTNAFQAVAAKIQEVRFFSLRNRYAQRADGCVRVRSDQSSVKFTVARSGQVKTVFLYYGCEGVPERDALAALATLVDSQTGLAPLLGRGTSVE